MKNSTALMAIAVIFVIGIACGGSKTPPPSQYVGIWTAADGSVITIRSDGSADYKAANSSVSGGSVSIDEAAKTMKISFAAIGPSFTIDSAPVGDKMTLSGIVYKKASNTFPAETSSSSSEEKVEIPSAEKLQTLVKTSMLDLGDAVKSGDFKDFHRKAAKVWRDSTSPAEMAESFKTFAEADIDVKKLVSSLDATFTAEPSVEKFAGFDALSVNGFYPTKPKKLYFDLKYAMDDGTLKLIGISIQTKN